VAGKAVTFLLDYGCNTNFLSKRVFDALPPKVRKELAPYTGEPGTLADGSRIPFYGVIELPGRVVEVEGTALRVNFRPRHLPAAHGASLQQTPLEDTASLPR